MQGTDKTDARDWAKNYADYLYGYAYKRVGNDDTARELVQETFLGALESLASFEQRSSEKTWLTSILRHKIADEYSRSARSRPAQPEQEDYFEENGFWKQAYQPQPFGLEAGTPANNREFERILQWCLEKLPPLWGAVFALKHLEEEKTTAICRRLQVTASHYWVIIHRAKMGLRDCLQKNGRAR